MRTSAQSAASLVTELLAVLAACEFSAALPRPHAVNTLWRIFPQLAHFSEKDPPAEPGRLVRGLHDPERGQARLDVHRRRCPLRHRLEEELELAAEGLAPRRLVGLDGAFRGLPGATLLDVGMLEHPHLARAEISR